MPAGLGQMIKRLRIRRGMTQDELARRAKLSQAYIAKLESGDRETPSLPALKRLAKALDVPVTKLLV
jgi:transcriptional regulator with XRE-family HTH domain